MSSRFCTEAPWHENSGKTRESIQKSVLVRFLNTARKSRTLIHCVTFERRQSKFLSAVAFPMSSTRLHERRCRLSIRRPNTKKTNFNPVRLALLLLCQFNFFTYSSRRRIRLDDALRSRISFSRDYTNGPIIIHYQSSIVSKRVSRTQITTSHLHFYFIYTINQIARFCYCDFIIFAMLFFSYYTLTNKLLIFIKTWFFFLFINIFTFSIHASVPRINNLNRWTHTRLTRAKRVCARLRFLYENRTQVQVRAIVRTIETNELDKNLLRWKYKTPYTLLYKYTE